MNAVASTIVVLSCIVLTVSAAVALIRLRGEAEPRLHSVKRGLESALKEALTWPGVGLKPPTLPKPKIQPKVLAMLNRKGRR